MLGATPCVMGVAALIRAKIAVGEPCLPALEPIYGPNVVLGRVAQRESTSLTSRGHRFDPVAPTSLHPGYAASAQQAYRSEGCRVARRATTGRPHLQLVDSKPGQGVVHGCGFRLRRAPSAIMA